MRRTTRSVTRAAPENVEKVTEEIDEENEETDEEDEEDIEKQQNSFVSFLGVCISIPYHLVLVQLTVFFVYALHLSCQSNNSCTFLELPEIPSFKTFFNWETVSFVFGWFSFLAFLSILPIGTLATGPILPKRSKLLYRLNGLASLIIIIVLLFFSLFGVQYYGKFPSDYMTVNYLSAVTGSFLYALLLSFVVFVYSRRCCSAEDTEPSEGAMADFVFGGVVNARFWNGTFDIKTFAFKAGFISWGVMNIGYILNAVSAFGLKSTMTHNPSLVILVVLQLWYVFDAMIFEETLLYAASLSSDKIGYMYFYMVLCFFPFFCSMQAKYLISHPKCLSWYYYGAVIILYVVGYYIYRVSAQQKFNFRKNPHKAKLSGVDYIITANQKNILVDGWWGRVRHPNYVGDWMMCVSWGLLCGFEHGLPWVWPISLIAILIGMAIRDDKKCDEKYGLSWEEYQERVKYKLIPYLF